MSAQAFEVLLAEDSIADAELVLHSLAEEVPVRMHRVHDGKEALDFLFARGAYGDRAAAPQPRLVLLDLDLPVVDGLQVLERAASPPPDVGAAGSVSLTSSNLEHHVAEGYRLGANSFVEKPLEFTKFRELVRRSRPVLAHDQRAATCSRGGSPGARGAGRPAGRRRSALRA